MEIIKIYQHKNLQLTKKEFYEKLSNFVEDNKESLVDKMSSYTYNNGKEEVIKYGHTKDSHIDQSPRTMLLRNLVQNIPCSTFTTEERANQVLYAALRVEKVKTKITKWFYETDTAKKDARDINILELNIAFKKNLGKGIDYGFSEAKSSELNLVIKRANGENELGFYIETAYPNLKTIDIDKLEYTGRNFIDKAIEYNDDLDNPPFSRYALLRRFMMVDHDLKISKDSRKNEIIITYTSTKTDKCLEMKICNSKINYNILDIDTGGIAKTNYKEIKEKYQFFEKPMDYIISSLKKSDVIINRQYELSLDE